jgi:hypothetical protein
MENIILNSVNVPLIYWELGQRRRYSEWLRAGRPRSRSSSPGRIKNFLFSKSSRPVQWPAQPSIHSHPTSAEIKKMWTYTFTPHTPSWRST